MGLGALIIGLVISAALSQTTPPILQAPKEDKPVVEQFGARYGYIYNERLHYSTQDGFFRLPAEE